MTRPLCVTRISCVQWHIWWLQKARTPCVTAMPACRTCKPSWTMNRDDVG